MLAHFIGYYSVELVTLSIGLSGVKLGRILGVNQQQVSRYERGITILSIETILLLCDCFNVTPEYFLAPVLASENYSSNKIITRIENVNYNFIALK